MPRPSRHKLTLTQESVEKHMNEVYSALEHIKQMGVRHYNFVLKIIEELGNDPDASERLVLMAQLEQSRNNSLKALQDYMKMKTDLITKHINAAKIFGDLDIKTNKKKDEVGEETGITMNEQDEIQKMIAEMSEMKKKF